MYVWRRGCAPSRSAEARTNDSLKGEQNIRSNKGRAQGAASFIPDASNYRPSD